MFPARMLLAVDGFTETLAAVRAAVALANGGCWEMQVVHVVPTTPELPYLHLAAKERVINFQEWRRLQGLMMLDDYVTRIEEDLAGSVAATYYREGKPEKEIVLLGDEIEAGLIIMGGRRGNRLERVFGASVAEKVLRRANRPVLMVDDRASRALTVPH